MSTAVVVLYNANNTHERKKTAIEVRFFTGVSRKYRRHAWRRKKPRISHNLPPTTDEVNTIARDVCLSVSKITQKRMHWFGWHFAYRQLAICMISYISAHNSHKCSDVLSFADKWQTMLRQVSGHGRTGTGLLSAISYALQRGILLRRENPTGIVIGRPSQPLV